MRWLERLGIAVAICAAELAGCTAVESRVVSPGAATPDGIPYFLPRRPFVVTVSTPSGGGLPSITVAPGAAEPDLLQEFVLSQGINLVAQNELNVTVASNGLLESSQSTATSEVAAVVQNAATTAGMFATPPAAAGGQSALSNVVPENALGERLGATQPSDIGPTIDCPPAGMSIQYFVYPEGRFSKGAPLRFICSDGRNYVTYSVRWHLSKRSPTGQTAGRASSGQYAPCVPASGRAASDASTASQPASVADVAADHYDGVCNANVNAKGRVSGLFFRHELPYLISITSQMTDDKGKAIKQQSTRYTESDFVVSSPDESETAFFPVTRNFFANNTANITITDGVITGVDQTTQSEIAAGVGLPATWLSSYMTAVGQLLSGLTSISSNRQKLVLQQQATAIQQTQDAAIAAAQYQACRKTLASFNFANMSAAQASAAAAAVQAACASSTTSAPGASGS